MDFSASTLLTFFAAGVVISTIPGPATAYITACTLAKGRKVGFLSVVGIFVGTFFHVLAVMFGLSAVLLKSAEAYALIKLVGSLYLVFLGVSVFLQKKETHNSNQAGKGASYLKVVSMGVLAAVLNPKLAIFFIAYLPQFVDESVVNVSYQFLFFGTFQCLIGLGFNIILVSVLHIVGGAASGFMNSDFATRWIPGALFVGVGAKLAIDK